jgi:hypothetical protein
LLRNHICYSSHFLSKMWAFSFLMNKIALKGIKIFLLVLVRAESWKHLILILLTKLRITVIYFFFNLFCNFFQSHPFSPFEALNEYKNYEQHCAYYKCICDNNLIFYWYGESAIKSLSSSQPPIPSAILIWIYLIRRMDSFSVLNIIQIFFRFSMGIFEHSLIICNGGLC